MRQVVNASFAYPIDYRVRRDNNIAIKKRLLDAEGDPMDLSGLNPVWVLHNPNDKSKPYVTLTIGNGGITLQDNWWYIPLNDITWPAYNIIGHYFQISNGLDIESGRIHLGNMAADLSIDSEMEGVKVTGDSMEIVIAGLLEGSGSSTGGLTPQQITDYLNANLPAIT